MVGGNLINKAYDRFAAFVPHQVVEVIRKVGETLLRQGRTQARIDQRLFFIAQRYAEIGFYVISDSVKFRRRYVLHILTRLVFLYDNTTCVSWKGFDTELDKISASTTQRAAGVIVEFNPLHDGHIIHLRETRRITGCEYIIAVMSGNFVQRGEPAICDKWRRTKMALLAGVDIVIELPLPYVICGADYFARGAVGLLAATGIVDYLCFGSESGDIGTIRECGKILAEEPPHYKKALRAALDEGNNYAVARGKALEAALTFAQPERRLDAGLVTLPNNGLGMEYCKALELLGNPMTALTTHRKPNGPSATAIRNHLLTDFKTTIPPHLPTFTVDILREAIDKGETVRINDFSDIFRHLIIKNDAPELGEGLHHRFRKHAPRYPRLTDLLAAVKTKRYTFTRLQRTAMQVILDVAPPVNDPPYIRILGFRKESAHLLGEITRCARLPVLTNGAAFHAPDKILTKELEAGDIYCLAYKHGSTRGEHAMPLVKH